jgi:hypothetical protein
MKLQHTLNTILLLLGLTYSACKKETPAPPPTLEIEDRYLSVYFPADEGSKTIPINTNVEDWTVSSNQDWCATNAIYNTQNQITISTSQNDSYDVRTATVKVTAGTLTKDIFVTQLGTEPVIILDSKSHKIDFKAQKIAVNVTTNLDLDISISESWIERHPDTKSAQVDLVEYVYEFDVASLAAPSVPRYGKIYFQQTDGELNDSVTVTQSMTLSDDYNPESTEAFEKDKSISILSATLSPSDKYQGGEDIAKSIDDDLSTLYHSPWAGMPDKPAITLEYALDPSEASIANYVVLHPRTSGPNGIIKSASIWINTEEDPNYTQVGTVSAPLSNNPVVVRFATPVINPRNVKVIVTDAYSGDAGKYYVSLAEFECYESRSMNAIEGDMVYFTDMTFSELKPGTTIEDISQIQNPFIQNIAAYLLAGTYESEFRVQAYEAYREVSDLAQELKTSGYCQFENPTGMYLSKDEEIVVFVGPCNGESIGLRVTDFGQSGDDYSYPLSEGVNILTMKGKGNGYLNYYTPNYQTATNIKVHIASGEVNGYFDRARHTEEDGQTLLDNAVSTIMDIKGARTQLAYSVNALRNNAYGQLKDLITVYDSIVSSEQTIMGLRKYKRLPKNHMFGRVIWNGYMHADGWGAAFHDNTMGTVANPASLRNSNWGVAHEFGHVNQVRPGMKWVGTTECTNNIYSAWAQYCYTPNNLRLEHENVGGTIGGRFNAFLNNGLVKGQEWGLQAGPDSNNYGTDDEGKWGGDHFVKLVPLWQLHLYYHIAGATNTWHKPYFWADIFEKVRITDESGLSHGQMQINFVKNTCDAVQQDLSEFFIKIGMLKEVDKLFGDYTSAQKTITQAMIDEAIAHASQYPKPETDYIYYISGNTIDCYKYKRAVSGTYEQGISGSTSKQIDHGTWQNVVVFETYSGSELKTITMAGTGSNGNTFTQVPYPSGSTRIEAVAYDGTKTLVYGTR